MKLEEFQRLPVEEVARLVREAGPKACVFPINGTRRWFMLERGVEGGKDFAEAFLDRMVEMHIRLYALCFDHGIHTLLSPIMGLDVLQRDDADVATKGMALLAGQRFLEFYRTYGVRVRFYGDYRRYLEKTGYAYLCELFEQATAQTTAHESHRLFFGVCANDATETVAEIGARFYQEHGCLPDRRRIVEAYYGEYVEPVDLFIGFGPLAAFDMPLVATGSEDLYFTISPSPYLDAHALRAILYDHLYARPGEPDYGEVTAGDWDVMRQFYRLNRGTVLGTGVRAVRGGVWYPTGGICLPDGFASLLLHDGS